MQKRCLVVFMISAVILSGCSNSLKLDPPKHPAIMVYPPLDMRKIKEPPLDKIESKNVLFKDRFTFVEEMLYNRNLYISRYLKNPKDATITYQDLTGDDPVKLKTIPSEGIRYVLIIVINKFTFKSFIITQSDIELEGYLIDKKDGTIVWKNSSAKELSQLTVLGNEGILIRRSKYYGVYVASLILLNNFPALKVDQNQYFP